MISFTSSVTMGAAGSPYGSEILFNAINGPNYLSISSQVQLATVLPCWMMINQQNVGVALQYTPDAGTTWRQYASTVSATLAYIDTGGTFRLFNGTGVTQNVFLIPIREGKV